MPATRRTTTRRNRMLTSLVSVVDCLPLRSRRHLRVSLQLSSDSDESGDDDDDDDDAMESVSRSSVSDQARSFGVGSLNTRPRKKVFRGLRQPRPLFGRSYQDGSPNSPGGASGPSPSPGSANGFAAMAARFRKVGPDNISPQFGAPLARASGASPRERITAFRVEDEDD